MSDIKPALTPEEWQGAMEQWRSGTVDVEDLLGLSANNQSTRKQMHAAAALCLYGQPFGFTREDVKELRAVAEDYEYRGLDPSPFDTLNALADRIEALLPPTP